MYTIELIKDLSDKLERGEISPNQCLKTLTKLRNERQELKERCEAMLTAEYNKEANRRMEMYKANPEYYELKSKLIDKLRCCRNYCNKDLKEQLSYLDEKDLAQLDPIKLANLNIDIQGRTFDTIYKSLEDLILIPKK